MIRRATAALLLLAVAVAACSARVPPSPSPSLEASPSLALEASPSLAPSPAASDPVLPPNPPSGVTRICEGPNDGQPELIPCSRAIDAAVSALGNDADRVAAAWFRYGVACPPNARCAAPEPGTGYVVLRFADGPTIVVPVQVAGPGFATGEAVAPNWDIWEVDPVVRPPAQRPEVGNAPIELANRVPLPYCGGEDDMFVRNVRRCFWAAVTSGDAAEYTTSVPAPDGTLVWSVQRFTGTGPILSYVDRTLDAAIGRWRKLDCAIESAPDDELIFILTECVETPFG